MESDTRGQSSAIGAILLVGVVTLSVGTYGAIYLSQMTAGAEEPIAEMSGEVTTTEVRLVHEAGDTLEESDLRVRLRADGTEWTNVTWESGSVSGTDDGLFSPGETWTWDDGNFTGGDRVEVFAVHEPTETLLFRGRLVVGADGGEAQGGGGGADSPPTASFSYSPSNPQTDEAVDFDASASDDPDGGSLTYQWTFGDGESGSGEAPQHSYGDDGAYDVTLTVTDDEGDTDSTTQTVTVSNRAPSASFSYTPSSPQTGETVAFDAITSDDPDGTIASYSWDFGDGATGSGEQADHTYANAGDYIVTLTVEDDDGATATATQKVTVTESTDSTAPSVTLDRPNGGETLRTGTTYTIEWSASDDSGVESVTLEYSTDGGSSWTTIDSGLANDGAYDWSVPSVDTTDALVRVTATDAAGNSASDESDSAFTIEPPPSSERTAVTQSSKVNGDSVQFTLQNDGSFDATITSITVDSTGKNVASVGNGAKSGNDYVDEGPEFESDKDGTLLDAPDPFAIGAKQSLDSTSTIAPGTQTTYTLGEFRGKSGKDTDPGNSVTITIGFGDGSTKQVTLSL